MITSHIHQFGEMKLIKVIADNPHFDLDNTGKRMGILVRQCTNGSCKQQVAFEYGERKAMVKLLKLLKGEVS